MRPEEPLKYFHAAREALNESNAAPKPVWVWDPWFKASVHDFFQRLALKANSKLKNKQKKNIKLIETETTWKRFRLRERFARKKGKKLYLCLTNIHLKFGQTKKLKKIVNMREEGTSLEKYEFFTFFSGKYFLSELFPFL